MASHRALFFCMTDRETVESHHVNKSGNSHKNCTSSSQAVETHEIYMRACVELVFEPTIREKWPQDAEVRCAENSY